METYVGLLRENTFSGMRAGLAALRHGTLAKGDMQVFCGARVVGVSPCEARGGSAGRGTVLELHVVPRVAGWALPEFGALVAVAHGREFGDATWATIAGAEKKKGKDGAGAFLRVFVELASDLNDDARDTSLLARLLRHSGHLTLVESPTSYRSFGPALEVLQRLEEARMPFLQEVVLGEEGPLIPLEGRTVDASVVFSPADPAGPPPEEGVATMDAAALCGVLLSLSRARPGADGTLARGALRTTLDPSQCAALHHILTRRVAVIQGPPGTGKSFTAVRAVQLLASLSPPLDQLETAPPGPVLVLTYKNKALDDFLLDSLKIWPNGVARIGSKPKAGSPLEHRHVAALMRAAGGTDPEVLGAKRAAEELSEAAQVAAAVLSERRFFSAETMLAGGAAAGGLLASLVLNDPTKSPGEVEQARADLLAGDRDTLLKHAAQALKIWMPPNVECARLCPGPAAPDRAGGGADQGGGDAEEEEEEESDRREVSFDRTTVALGAAPGAHARAVLELRLPVGEVEAAELLATEDVWCLPKGETRVRFMHAIVREQYEQAEKGYDAAMQAYLLAVEKLRREEMRGQAKLLRNFKVVGMTISGAAINRDALEELRPSCVLVEEAAETLEPLLLAALGPWVQRLILIGDHKQLPPKVEEHVLARDYFFDTSLMERLIANKLPHVMLEVQARMMPEFAALLTSVYPALRTSARVAAEHRVSPPPGCATSMFFWDTGKACGEASSEGGSTENPGEACAVVAIAVHLIRSGVAPDHITVLAPYALQVARITRLLALEVPKVAESGWPSEQRHGKAADLQAGALMDRHAAGRALPNDPQLCLATAETLLKLGRTPPTARLLKHATGLQQVREPAPAGDAARRDGARAAQLAALVVRVEAQVAAVDAFWDGCAAQALQHPGEAINALKRLEGFAVEWKTQGFISAAAAACHARIVMAKRIAAAPAQLSEGMKGLLDVLRKKAEQLLADFATSEGAVHVSSIDRFQGSENDVVLVSLTRSNARGQVGFLKEQARLVVAQSRARLGMYFIGDRATYDTVKHWRAFSAAMHARECAGAKIPLACPRHPAQITHLAVKDAQRLLTTALCQHVCGRRMACGRHTCLQLCHGEELDHHSLCREMVDDTCKAGHLIRRRCCDAAGEIACRRCAELEAARKRAAEKLRAEREAREREEVERRKKEADVLAEAERARAQRAWEESEMLHRDVIKQKLAALAQSSSSVTKTQLGRSGEWAAEFLKVVDRTEKYVQVAHGTPIVVSRIEKVSNPALEKLFLEAKMRLRSGVADDRCGMMQLFHGTGVEGVKGIPLNGFRLPGKSEDNMFGQGVYFATDSSKSAQSMYTKDSRCLILCDVLLGKTCAVEALKQQHPLSKHVKTSSKKRPYLDVDLAAVQKAGYDSVFAPRGGDRGAGGVLFDEFIVYDPAQAIPRFIVHFGACPALGDAGASWRHPATTLGARVTVRTLTAREVNADNSNSPEVTHYNMAYAQYHRLLGSSAKAVHTVDFYESEAVTRRFQEKKAEFARDKKPIKEIWVFHGTPDIANVAKICSGGLKVGGRDGLGVRNGAVYGAGAYTATGPGTPMGYSSGTRCVILCLGLTGTEGAKEQSDCWVGGGPDVRIFAHGDQLLPRYVVHFEGE